MSPLMTIRRFENAAHGALPRPLDTVVMVAGAAIVVGTIMIGSPNDTAFNAVIVPGLIVAMAIAARVGREAAQRRRGENSFGTSAIGLSRFVYLGCAAIAAIMTVVFGMTPALTQLSELLGV
ncbi:MAG: hypothetical protein ING29_16045 [Azospirillum sp.]|nr:hypothetical protein [Azospirillum sp.]